MVIWHVDILVKRKISEVAGIITGYLIKPHFPPSDRVGPDRRMDIPVSQVVIVIPREIPFIRFENFFNFLKWREQYDGGDILSLALKFPLYIYCTIFPRKQ